MSVPSIAELVGNYLPLSTPLVVAHDVPLELHTHVAWAVVSLTLRDEKRDIDAAAAAAFAAIVPAPGHGWTAQSVLDGWHAAMHHMLGATGNIQPPAGAAARLGGYTDLVSFAGFERAAVALFRALSTSAIAPANSDGAADAASTAVDRSRPDCAERSWRKRARPDKLSLV